MSSPLSPTQQPHQVADQTVLAASSDPALRPATGLFSYVGHCLEKLSTSEQKLAHLVFSGDELEAAVNEHDILAAGQLLALPAQLGTKRRADAAGNDDKLYACDQCDYRGVRPRNFLYNCSIIVLISFEFLPRLARQIGRHTARSYYEAHWREAPCLQSMYAQDILLSCRPHAPPPLFLFLPSVPPSLPSSLLHFLRALFLFSFVNKGLSVDSRHIRPISLHRKKPFTPSHAQSQWRASIPL
jgi:hypothetical protein